MFKVPNLLHMITQMVKKTFQSLLKLYGYDKPYTYIIFIYNF